MLTTSGPGTGQAASAEKMRVMKEALGWQDFSLTKSCGICSEPARWRLTMKRSTPDPHARNATAGAQRDLRAERFEFSKLNGQTVLVVGLGGGCDVISAYAVARLLSASYPAKVVYGNTKRHVESELEYVSPHVRRFPSVVCQLGGKGTSSGATRIDQSIPRGPDACPWIFHIPKASRVRVEHELANEIKSLGFDLTVAVDTGGDSIVDTAFSGHWGRDKQMLRVVRATGIPVIHVVVGPGSDGEACQEDLQICFEALAAEGRYRGCLSLAPVLPVFREQTQGLSESRTPRIILAAAENRLEQDEDESRVIVPRGIKPAIPRAWLTSAFVFV